MKKLFFYFILLVSNHFLVGGEPSLKRLHYAVIKGGKEIEDILKKEKCLINSVQKFVLEDGTILGWTPLGIAVCEKKTNIVSLLCSNGADCNGKIKNESCEFESCEFEKWYTPCALAIIENYIDGLEILVKKKECNINDWIIELESGQKFTALGFVLYLYLQDGFTLKKERGEMLSLLCKHGAIFSKGYFSSDSQKNVSIGQTFFCVPRDSETDKSRDELEIDGLRSICINEGLYFRLENLSKLINKGEEIRSDYVYRDKKESIPIDQTKEWPIGGDVKRHREIKKHFLFCSQKTQI